MTDGERAKRVPLLYSALAKLQVSASRQEGGVGRVDNSSSSSSSSGKRVTVDASMSTGFDFADSEENDPLSQSMASRSGRGIGFSN